MTAKTATEVAVIPAVYAALSKVRTLADASGIAKDGQVNDGVKFKFRGIDAVLDSFSGWMREANLMCVPSYGSVLETSRPTAKGTTYNTRCQVVLRFISLDDGSDLVAGPFYGEANDTQDKGTAKSQSIALRIGYLTTFVVPLGPGHDIEDDQVAEDEPAAAPAVAKPAAKGELVEPSDDEPLSQDNLDALAGKAKMAGLGLDDLRGQLGTLTRGKWKPAMAIIKSKLAARDA